MIGISFGIKGFNTINNRLPKNLKEVVDGGFLPEKSRLYFCPMKHHTPFSKSLPYTECEYEYEFEPNQVVIKIPDEVCEHRRFKWITDYEKELIVYKDNYLFYPSQAYYPENQR